jgi:hypothetical protein
VGRTIDAPLGDELDGGAKDKLIDVAKDGAVPDEEAITRLDGAAVAPSVPVRAGSKISDSKVVGSGSEDA